MQDEVTKEVFLILKERQNKVAHGLGNGAALDAPIIYAEAVGRYREIDDLLKMSYEDMKDDKAS